MIAGVVIIEQDNHFERRFIFDVCKLILQASGNLAAGDSDCAVAALPETHCVNFAFNHEEEGIVSRNEQVFIVEDVFRPMMLFRPHAESLSNFFIAEAVFSDKTRQVVAIGKGWNDNARQAFRVAVFHEADAKS